MIAEIKKASPSAGVIVADFDPLQIARAYETAGAAALSVLTDEPFFQGRLEFLSGIRSVVRLPLLRKDFILDELQVYQSAAHGADAILLIVAILDDHQLRSYTQLARQLQLETLVEVHDEAELERALAVHTELIGVNNRNLKDFTVDLGTTERLGTMLGRQNGTSVVLVAESGISGRADVDRVAAAGAAAVLVGESLMRSGDIRGKVMELMGTP